MLVAKKFELAQPMRFIKGLLGLLLLAILTAYLAHEAQHGTRGLIIDNIIHLSPHGARIFHGALACMCAFLFVIMLIAMGIVLVKGEASTYRNTPPPRRVARQQSLVSLLVMGLILFIALKIGIYSAAKGGWIDPSSINNFSFSTPPPPPQVSYQGTSETSFGKDWVSVDGKTYQGIIQVNPVSNGQVAILYADGGKDIPASKLPQGFLDAWQLTPQRLQAANRR